MMKNWYVGFFLAILLSMFFFFLQRNRNFEVVKKEITVVCTTGMIADVVSIICADFAIVHGLMGPGVDPHLYVANAGDIQKLSDADIIFYNGLHLEGKMNSVFQSLQAYKKVVSVSDAIPRNLLRSSDYKDISDPHIWHDVSLWMYVVNYISDSLIALDPQHEDVYRERMHMYQKKLTALHESVHNLMQLIPKQDRILVTAHDAFGYFGAQYGLQVIGLQGMSTDSDIGINDVQQLVDFIISNEVKAIFLESSISKRNILAVTQALEQKGKSIIIGEELFSDALGDNLTGADHYIGMIMHNAYSIVTALTGEVFE